MKDRFAIISLLIFLVGCNEHAPVTQHAEMFTDTVKAEIMKHPKRVIAPPFRDSIFGIESYTNINIFDTLNGGCNDLFAIDTGLTQYIFVSNLINGVAIIKVNGDPIYMMRDTSIRDTLKDADNRSFEGNGYRVTLRVRMIQQYDEGGEYKGTMDVMHEGKKETINIIGESGC